MAERLSPFGTPNPDRRHLSVERMAMIAILLAVQVWATLAALPRGSSAGRSFTVEAAIVVSLLAVFGLRSVPIRWIIRGLGLFTGLLMGRFGELGHQGGFAGSWKVLVWIAALGCALILAPSSRSILGESASNTLQLHRLPSNEARRFSPLQVVVAAAVISVVVGASLLVGPRVAQQYPLGSSVADVIDGADRRSNNSLLATDRLDMTTRPRLSDQVVMSVRSPLRTFWRTETFDVWDGSAWTRSQPYAGVPVSQAELMSPMDDLSARFGETFDTDFRFEVGFATAVPHAPAAVAIDTKDDLIQRSDGTLVSPFQPLGRNTAYSITSRQLPITATLLRTTTAQKVAADRTAELSRVNSSLISQPGGGVVLAEAQVASNVLDQYSNQPVATERVRELAHQIASQTTNDYDTILAFESWMDTNTEYSLEAPLAPKGVDVVDDFLFESQLGWCEQIASSLVVLAREVGIPARLVTGFTHGDWDPVSGRFTVREHHAHAWAEVWFPQAGWVAFDPTADIPLAGDATSATTAAAADWREQAGLGLGVVGLMSLMLILLGGHIARFAQAVDGWVRLQRRKLKYWWVKDEVALERLGKKSGLVRHEHETLRDFGERVILATGDETIRDRVTMMEAGRFGP